MLMQKKNSLEQILIKSNIIETYDDLVKELKRQELSPKKAYNLIIKQKLKFDNVNIRTRWLVERIGMYLETRKKVAVSILLNEIKSITAKGGIVLTRDKITTLKRIVIVRDQMPSKKKSCENTVNNTTFKIRWEFYNQSNKTKWDPRKEAQNLQKIVTEKKFNKWFSKNNHAYIYNDLSKYELAIKDKEQRFINTIR